MWGSSLYPLRGGPHTVEKENMPMTMQFNIEEAASWDDEQAATILAWLRDRPWRYDEVNKILELRGEEPTGESDGAETSTEEFDFDSKIDDVLAWVGQDAGRAVQALEAENEKGDDARVTLVQALEEIATA
jgi:hypothetical protein